MVPTPDGFVPPHSPFPPREAVDWLKIHDGAETLDVVHEVQVNVTRRLCSFADRNVGETADKNVCATRNVGRTRLGDRC